MCSSNRLVRYLDSIPIYLFANSRSATKLSEIASPIELFLKNLLATYFPISQSHTYDWFHLVVCRLPIDFIVVIEKADWELWKMKCLTTFLLCCKLPGLWDCQLLILFRSALRFSCVFYFPWFLCVTISLSSNPVTFEAWSEKDASFTVLSIKKICTLLL